MSCSNMRSKTEELKIMFSSFVDFKKKSPTLQIKPPCGKETLRRQIWGERQSVSCWTRKASSRALPAWCHLSPPPARLPCWSPCQRWWSQPGGSAVPFFLLCRILSQIGIQSPPRSAAQYLEETVVRGRNQNCDSVDLQNFQTRFLPPPWLYQPCQLLSSLGLKI